MLYKTAVYESNLWIFECLRIMSYYDNAHVGTNLRWKYMGNIEIYRNTAWSYPGSFQPFHPCHASPVSLGEPEAYWIYWRQNLRLRKWRKLRPTGSWLRPLPSSGCILLPLSMRPTHGAARQPLAGFWDQVASKPLYLGFGCSIVKITVE